METKTYTTIDRQAEKWGAGPWDGEPDKVQWTDAATGLPCLAVRHPSMGHWCGYVGVAEGHPWYEVGYSEVDATVHGGLTFANMCHPAGDEARDICHVPEPGEPDHVWWLGFDCNHSFDSSPWRESWEKPMPGFPSIYRTLAYVQDQCAELASQAAMFGRPARPKRGGDFA